MTPFDNPDSTDIATDNAPAHWPEPTALQNATPDNTISEQGKAVAVLPNLSGIDPGEDYPEEWLERSALSDDTLGLFDLEFKQPDTEAREKYLADWTKRIAVACDRKVWKSLPGGFASTSPPSAYVFLTPEGYGKSSLVGNLVSAGFKVVFCAKSNAQLMEKEKTFNEILGLTTCRYVSKEQNFRHELSMLDIPASEFKLTPYESSNPYAAPIMDEAATLESLIALFEKYDIDPETENPVDFFQEHYLDYQAPAPDGMSVDVTLITFAAFQVLANGRTQRWWERLGFIAGFRKVSPDDEGYPRFNAEKLPKDDYGCVTVNVCRNKLAVMIDDPDRSDVDWMRGLSDEAAEALLKVGHTKKSALRAETKILYYERIFTPPLKFPQQFNAVTEQLKKQLHKEKRHQIVKHKNRHYIMRPPEMALGYRFFQGDFGPKMIVTTTEWNTGYFALKTLQRSRLNTRNDVEVFHTKNCLVTAITSTITRKRNHAVLLVIIEKLKDEFPDEDVTLIADGLNCEYNLSSNKGRNDLSEKTTVIKLSWPHPQNIATMDAHFHDVEELNHNLLVATMLADLGNQALGRNQGFRFKGQQAFVIIDPRYSPVIMEHGLLRYELTPWSAQLPNYNERTARKTAKKAQMISTEQRPLERRLLELIHNFRIFGMSDEARQLAKRLPQRQREHYDMWLERNSMPALLAAMELRGTTRRAQVANNVRKHRARKKANAKAP